MGRTPGIGRWALSSVLGWAPSLVLVVLAAVSGYNRWGGDAGLRIFSLLFLLSTVTPGVATAGQVARLQQAPTGRPVSEKQLLWVLAILWAVSLLLAVIIGLDLQTQCIDDWDLV